MYPSSCLYSFSQLFVNERYLPTKKMLESNILFQLLNYIYNQQIYIILEDSLLLLEIFIHFSMHIKSITMNQFSAFNGRIKYKAYLLLSSFYQVLNKRIWCSYTQHNQNNVDKRIHHFLAIFVAIVFSSYQKSKYLSNITFIHLFSFILLQ